MTEQETVIDEQNPWPGLAAFDEDSGRFFNGRNQEKTELHRLLLQSPLTVLFGVSGLGKTSLVQAGLFPLLRKENVLPVYVRLDVRERRTSLMDQAKAALEAEVLARGVEAPSFNAGESLWEYLHRENLELWSAQNYPLTPLFVFDQFEEVFTIGAENRAAIDRFRIDLADLVENRMPFSLTSRIAGGETEDGRLSLNSQRYRILLSLREDFLPPLEGWKRDLPSLARSHFRLLHMSGEQAFDAVYKTAPHLVSSTLAEEIVQFLAAAQKDSGARVGYGEGMSELVVEPALLSLVCRGLNERRKAQKKSAFDESLLKGTGSSIISDFYRESLADQPEGVQRFIEKELITERGFRKQCDTGDARTLHNVTDEQLRLLVNRRLLRIVPQRGTEQVELTHDLLTRAVREHRDRQREIEKARLQRQRAVGAAAIGVILAVLVGFFLYLYLDARRQRLRADDVAMQNKKLVEALQDRNKSVSSVAVNPVATTAPPPVSEAPPPEKGMGLPPIATAPPQPQPQAGARKSFLAPELALLYKFPAELDGRGQTIGLIELGGGYTDSDLQAYFSRLKVPVPKVTQVSVGGAHNQPGTDSDFQVAMDIEIAGGVAPGAQLVVYFAPNSNKGFADALNVALHDTGNKPGIISIGWGSPEPSWSPQTVTALDGALKQAASNGITVTAAAGDHGVTDGLKGLHAVDFPGSSLWVLACGGTSLRATGSAVVSEVAWNSGSAGGVTGGGISALFPAPPWQSAVAVASLDNGRKGRGVPDVSANADPSSGYSLLVHGNWSVLGGTSAVAPFWAGLVALLNQGVGHNIGYLNPLLYQSLGPAGVFRAITQGNNSIDGVKGYSAGPGWNPVTGWGVPDGEKLLAALKSAK